LVHPEVIKGGHIIDLIDSVVKEFRSSVVKLLRVQLWSVSQWTMEAEEVTDS
jgi:hypothetical protein